MRRNHIIRGTIAAFFAVFFVSSAAFATDTEWTLDSNGTDIYSTNGTAGYVGIGTAPSHPLHVYADATNNVDPFVFSVDDGYGSRRSFMKLQSNDVIGTGQDESALMTIQQNARIRDEADAFSMLSIVNNSGTALTAEDRLFYVAGRDIENGAPTWGVDLQDADVWTQGSVYGGATGVDCAFTNSPCFTDASFQLSANGDSYITGGKLGLGTTTPTAGLHLSSDDGLLAEGTYGSGSIPVEGAGTRMMWYPGKAAFRAGRVTGTEWDDANVGEYSVAFGNEAEAVGANSFAFGEGAEAEAGYSIAFGSNSYSRASSGVALGNSARVFSGGTSAIAVGSSAEASASSATALGSHSEASGSGAVAIGGGEASSSSTIALGSSSQATDQYAAAISPYAVASGQYSTAVGYHSDSIGQSSGTFGNHNEASAEKSYAIGSSTEASVYKSMAIGFYNETMVGDASSWVSTDPLFVVGNGQTTSNRSNALMILKNGDVGIGTNTPTEALDVDGNIQASGQICDSNGCIGTSSSSSPWTQSGTSVYYTTGSVGVGTSSPTADLEVDGTDGVVFGGTHGSGSIPATGAGSRMMWYPAKSAFRVGYVSGSHWDAADTGYYSASIGLNTEASGTSSISIGDGAIANQTNAIAIGRNVTASGTTAVATGRGGTASGDDSFVANSDTIASGDYASALNYDTDAVGTASFSAGVQSTARGDRSAAFGTATVARSFGSFAIGQYNEYDTAEDETNWDSTDPLFVIGNGTSSARSNAFVVKKDGEINVTGDIVADGEICIGSGC